MAGGRVYVPPHRRAALLAALVLVALLALARRPGKNATQRSGRMLIEAQPAAGAVPASSQPVGDVPTALTASGGAGPVASLPVTAQAQPPSAPRAPNVLPGDMPAAPADEGAQRSTSALSAASQALLAEATAKVALPDDQIAWQGKKTIVSWHPRAFVLHAFLSPAECAYLIERAAPHMQVSTVVDNESGKSVPSTVRTSTGLFFDRGEDAVILEIERRIALVTDLPLENGEGMQVLHYDSANKAKYEPHQDYFHDTVNSRPENGGQRVASLVMYLSTPDEGGETVFPRASTKVAGPGWSECAKEGLAVKATAGDALLFYNLLPDGALDPNSLHGSCPTLRGHKWSATKWLHTGRFGGDGLGALARWGACADLDPACPAWAARGECGANPGFMLASCRRSCAPECAGGVGGKEAAGAAAGREAVGAAGAVVGTGAEKEAAAKEDEEELVDLNGDLGLAPGEAARRLMNRIRDAEALADAKKRQAANEAAAARGEAVVL